MLKRHDMEVSTSSFKYFGNYGSRMRFSDESLETYVNRMIDMEIYLDSVGMTLLFIEEENESGARPLTDALSRAQMDYFNATDQARIVAPKFGTESFTFRDLKRVIDEFNDTETLTAFLDTFAVGWEGRLTFDGSWTELKNSLAEQIAAVPGAADFFVRKAAVWVGASGIPNHTARFLFKHAGLVDLSKVNALQADDASTRYKTVFTFGFETVTKYDLWNIFKTIPASDILSLAANELGTRGQIGDTPFQAINRIIDELGMALPGDAASFFEKLKPFAINSYDVLSLLVVRLRQREKEDKENLGPLQIVFGVDSPGAPLLKVERTPYDEEITVTRGEFAAAFGNVWESEYFEITSALQNLGVIIPRGDLAEAFNASWAQLANNTSLMERFLTERYYATQSSKTKVAISAIIGKIKIIDQRQRDHFIPAASVNGMTVTRGDITIFVANFESLENLYAFKFDANRPWQQNYVPNEVLSGTWGQVRKAYTEWLLANPQVIPAIWASRDNQNF